MLVREGVHVDEDLLTHAVFGLLRYLPSELWFHPFLQKLRQRNPRALKVLNRPSTLEEVRLWPSFPVPDEWGHAFWRPQRRKGELEIPKGSIYPDALIETSDWIMLVECEYSLKVDTEQLFQQFAVASREAGSREFFVLLVNDALSRPSHCKVASANRQKPKASVKVDDSIEDYVAKCCSLELNLPFDIHQVTQRLLWISWQALYGLLRDLKLDEDPGFHALPRYYRNMIEIMCQDVRDLLEREGLVPPPYGIVEELLQLQVTLEAIPSFAVITPILPVLNDLSISLNALPGWTRCPNILKGLSDFQLSPDCIPDPLVRRQG